ncbi:MAG: hypothetical protein U1A72_17020 [Sulfuritalea sp.]|nr:hypothetical protein [Sulfuritalea sp.]
MKLKRFKEIPALVLKAVEYCEAIPEGDVRRQVVVPPIMEQCSLITKMMKFFLRFPGLAPEGSAATVEELGDWMRSTPHGGEVSLMQHQGRLETSLAQLETWLVRGQAFELAQKVGAVRAGRAKGGAETARMRQRNAQQRQRSLRAAAKQLLKGNPHLSKARIAEILAERGHGGAEAIKKLL